MKHDITMTGYAFRLRPIADEDVSLVLELRCDPERNRYINRTLPDPERQLAWFASYYQRPGDYYFVIERNNTGHAEGLIAIYDVDDEGTNGEWGRWVIRRKSLAAIESALLIYRCAFEVLGLEWICCRTVADNKQVISFHDQCGITDMRSLPAHVVLDGKTYDSVEHRTTAEAWIKMRPALDKAAKQIAQMMERER
jgi:RimJ/RimL family protein N-acetyltransferase